MPKLRPMNASRMKMIKPAVSLVHSLVLLLMKRVEALVSLVSLVPDRS